MKPLHQKLIVEIIKIPQSGLIKAPFAMEIEPHFARVVEVPNGIPGVKPGDTVLYRPDMEEVVEVDDQSICLLHWGNIIATMSHQNEYDDLFT